jgi:hypothetical protein
MSLIDSEKKVLMNKENKPKTGRRAKDSGLGRFKSLNKYKQQLDKLREKSTIKETKKDTKTEQTNLSAKINNTITNDYVNNTVTNEINNLDDTKKESSSFIKTLLESDSSSKSAPKNEIFINETEKASLKIDNNQISKSNYKDNKQETVGEHRVNNKVSSRYQIDIKTDNTTDPASDNKSKIFGWIEHDVKLIFGQKREILELFFNDCRSIGSLTTSRYRMEYIADHINSTVNQAKTQIHRLVSSGYLERLAGKIGRGGWVQFKIPKTVYDSMSNEDLSSKVYGLNKEKSISKNLKEISEQITEQITNNPSKLVSNLNNTNNTKPYDFSVEDLNIEDLRMLGITSKAVGDSIRNLNKYLENNKEQIPMSKIDFQDFINKFVEYANSAHGKTMKSKAAIFIGEIQKFQKEGTCSTLDWHNDREYEIYEQFVKEQEQKLKRRNELLEKAVEFKFLEWRNSQNKDDLLQLVPESQFSKFGGPGYELELKKYFRDNLWEVKKNEIS